MLAESEQSGHDGGWFRRNSKPLRATKYMLRGSLAVVKEHRRAYLLLNLTYYGLIAAAMAYAAFHPALQRSLLGAMGEAVGSGPMQTVAGAYGGGHLLLAVVITFAVNLVGGSFAYVTLSSLIVPFSGLLLGAFRALLWGLMFSPTAVMGAGFFLLLPTIVLEGQGYVLAMLAAYVQGMAFVRPRSVGAKTHGRGYLEGLKLSAGIYVLVALVSTIRRVVGVGCSAGYQVAGRGRWRAFILGDSAMALAAVARERARSLLSLRRTCGSVSTLFGVRTPTGR